ncbi:MAG TPA: hypothetical protein VLT36_11310 [Candidatus Dormibacteraeota bacterium]|nr:hypothetical protein [Candidatus Dormibacteraeota bacterium]
MANHSGTNWVVSTIAGYGPVHGLKDDTNGAARLNLPQGIALDQQGTLFVADTLNRAIRTISPIGTNWVVTTIAGMTNGTGGVASSADGTNNSAGFNDPYDLTLDAGGSVYVADTGNNSIRKITRFGTDWAVTTIAGQTLPGSADGTNTSARFNGPAAIAVDSATNLYVADFGNNTIRKISPVGTNWVTTTIAGMTNAPPGSTDGTNSAARFNQPFGIAASPFGYLYVTDSGNNTIRKLYQQAANWVVTTVAGLAGPAGAVDGTGSAARFSAPQGIDIDSSGNLYVADYGNFTLRRGDLAVLMNNRLAASKLIVSWPIAATGFVAEAKTTLTAGSWLPVTNVPAAIGDEWFITNGLSGSANFFRLHHP